MRRLAAIRAAYGVFLLVASGAIVERVTGERSRMVTVGRMLGVRHVVQALALGRTRSRGLLTAGMGVDVLHALSMAILAVCDDQHRRLAALDAAMASFWATSGWLSRRNS